MRLQQPVHFHDTSYTAVTSLVWQLMFAHLDAVTDS